MSAFAPIMYWFAGRQFPTDAFMAEACERYGVDSFDGVPHNRSSDSEGPAAGKRGCLIAIGSTKPVVYNAKSYRYHSIGDGVYVGARKSQPEEFRRELDSLVPGNPVRLNDGNLWYVPQANPLVSTCTLPCMDALIDGDWQRVPEAQFEALSGEALELAAMYRLSAINGDPFSMNDNELRELVGRILSINYDLTLQEMSVLGLFNADIWRQVIETFIDWRGYLALLSVEFAEAGTVPAMDPPQERATPATNDTPSGEPDSQPTTPPPAQTCSC